MTCSCLAIRAILGWTSSHQLFALKYSCWQQTNRPPPTHTRLWTPRTNRLLKAGYFMKGHLYLSILLRRTVLDCFNTNVTSSAQAHAGDWGTWVRSALLTLFYRSSQYRHLLHTYWEFQIPLHYLKSSVYQIPDITTVVSSVSQVRKTEQSRECSRSPCNL